MDDLLYIAQKGSNKHIEFLPYEPEGWHAIDGKFGTEVQFRTHSTIWSLGAVNINEIGTSVLYIPFSENTSSAGTVAASHPVASHNLATTNRGVVLHVEVKLADPSDNCSIIIFVWQDTIESKAAMSINNETEVPITVRQAEIEFGHDLGGNEHLYEMTVPPGKHLPFGWTDPDCGTYIRMAIGNTLLKVPEKRITTLNMLKCGLRLRLPYSSTKANTAAGATTMPNEIVVKISTTESGHVLHISRITSSLYLPRPEEEEEARDTILDEEEEEEEQSGSSSKRSKVSSFTFNVFLSSLGVSLIFE
jgi:hypothetical protein